MSIIYAKFYYSRVLCNLKYSKKGFARYIAYCVYIFVSFYSKYYIHILLLSGDVELNPGPNPNSSKSFSICHWNLNSITSHSFIKVSLLTAYNTIHKYDIICISESFLNSQNSINDDNLSIPGYNMFRADHPSDSRRGGVCVYY